ncbi:phosphocholine cytidylyltransferase family protein [Rhizorhapis sp. SPR117]|uniref:phosphocholine cytidylyltransferase family protein n=1 Tax=Rhizorhapis sp. SPR117 TaxID=2912611 RepID=UPI001F460E66|nr:phosphocholine cytidylyltransferase family protein [Rhizorhapis sp. SPR117]
MRAIVLSAGRGSRLGDLTRDRPKCLLEFAGRSLLDWQIAALRGSGVTDIIVVAGFNAKRVARSVAGQQGVYILYNPFYGVADNLASLWLARDFMDRDFLVLNGDTLVSPEIVRKLLLEGDAPINITVTRKLAYDADDMKVRLDGDRIAAVGKRLPAGQIDAESIGLLSLRHQGTAHFRQAVENAMTVPSGLENWYLSVIDTLAGQIRVAPVFIDGMPSAEVDYPADLAPAKALAESWSGRTAASAGTG